jgi:hypothetical protein
MVSPVHGDYRRCQAEIPLIVLCRFPGPALKPGYMALHGCDNPACFSTEPGHVYEGTSSDNHKDKWDRNLEYAEAQRKILSSPERREIARENGIRTSNNSEYRKRASEHMKKRWEDPEFKECIRAYWDKQRQEAATRRKWVEDFLAKQNEASHG